MDDTCEDGFYYLAYTANPSDPDTTTLDYENLPPIYDVNGGNVSRADFEGDGTGLLCDDTACQPTSGGLRCSALVCEEVGRVRFFVVGSGCSFSVLLFFGVLFFWVWVLR